MPPPWLTRATLDPWRRIDEDRHAVPWRGSADVRALVTVVTSAVVLTFLHYVVLKGPLQEAVVAQLDVVQGPDAHRWRPLARNLAWAVGCIFFYVAIPSLVVRLVLRERLRDWGWHTRGFTAHLPTYAVLYLPVAVLVLLVAQTPAFQMSYPFYRRPLGMADLLLWELVYAGQFVALEFFFRGFMLRGLEPRYGNGAVLLMVVPYCMVHFQKPMLESLAAIIAGVVLGVLALRTRSIWGGACIHVAVAWTMEAAAFAHQGWPDAG